MLFAVTILYRFAKSNMILAGVWYSTEKPLMNVYLRPLIDSLNELSNTGVFNN